MSPVRNLIFLLAVSGMAPTGHAQPDDGVHQLFVTQANCVACHNGLSTVGGEDVSIGANWSASMMANSALDPYWQAAVRRETLDHPESGAAIENECAACHMPMARFKANTEGREGEVFVHLPANVASNSFDTDLARDGVSCSLCHQIMGDNFGQDSSLVAGFHINMDALYGSRTIYGPYKIDEGRMEIMRSAAGYTPTEGTHIQRSEMCATCHTLITEALGAGGSHMGVLYEQMPYQEWQHSSFNGTQSCQDCHMPQVQGLQPVAAVLGQPREGFNRHDFRGGNFFIQHMLNRYRNELGVTASTQAFETAANRTIAHLQSGDAGTVNIDATTISNGTLTVTVSVVNAGGHKLPTAYPSRRLWLNLSVKDAGGKVLFESGRFNSNGSVTGNDNDGDARRYEPHYSVIDSQDQVQIYEAIIAGADGEITTGLLTATRYLKDNRLLPLGFDKRTSPDNISVTGPAMDDADFTDGRDSLQYLVNVGNAAGPFRVEARLWYQPVAYRWAENLGAYEAMETQRFLRYYRAMAAESAIIMDSAQTTVTDAF